MHTSAIAYSSAPHRFARPALGALLAASCVLLASGCVHRSLTIRTEPPGAQVYVNDELKGVSPVTYDFTWYGWHRIMVRKEGYQRVDDRKELRAPLYLWIPLDLVMELLPLPVRDRRIWSYALTPSATLPAPAPPVLIPAKPMAQSPADAAAPAAGVPAASAEPSATPPATTEPTDDAR